MLPSTPILTVVLTGFDPHGQKAQYRSSVGATFFRKTVCSLRIPPIALENLSVKLLMKADFPAGLYARPKYFSTRGVISCMMSESATRQIPAGHGCRMVPD